MAAMMLSFTGCSLDDLPFGPGNEQEENKGNENTGADIPEEPLTSGPASVAITRATATTAHFEGCITNDDIDLDFVQITVRYAEPENFSAMSDNIPSVVITRPDFEKDNKFSFNIENLHHNTLYKFCAIVQYKSEVFYSDVDEFKTAGVDIELAVKEGSITDSSVEFIGSVHGLSPEDEGKLEIGLIYGDNKSLVEGGEGEMAVIDAIAEDGTFNLSLTSLYDGGPTFYFRSYVEQDGDYAFGEIDLFELLVEPVRLIKKITRHEKALDEEFSQVYEFEYDSRGKMTSSKVLLGYEDWYDEVRYTYDYSTNGMITITEHFYHDGEIDEENTFKVNIDNKGRATSSEYIYVVSWEENGYIYEDTSSYNTTFNYSIDGRLERWCTSTEYSTYESEYSYMDGHLTKVSMYDHYNDGDFADDDYYYLTIDESFTSDHRLKQTSFDINKALIPLCPEEMWYVAINTGNIGNYYFNGMYVESVYCYIPHLPDSWATYDANYEETFTTEVTLYENCDEELDIFAFTSVNYDKDGYPIEFIADIRQYDAEVEVTYAAGEISGNDYYGTFYEIVEVDRKIISRGPATSIGAATFTIEYCE